MATPIRLAVLLKPDDAQPALDRAAQYARVNPEIEVVAIRIVNNYKDSEIEQLRSKENAKFESLKRLYSSIEKFSFKVLFDKDVADTFTDECRNGSYSIAVISANKRHTIRDIFISSIDSSIMRNSTIPLLVVKSASQTATLGQNVLLAIDFNEVAHLDKLDDYLFEAASQFAKSFDGKVHLANCVTPQSSGLMGGNLDQSKIINNTGVLNPVGLHHKLALETSYPLFLRFEPVGCTETILCKLYEENGVEITKEMATLMVSAIISDTLLLKSPTTTEDDVKAVEKLAEIAEIDAEEYGLEMLKAGTDLSSFSIEEILALDAKQIDFKDVKSIVNQVNTASIPDVLEMKDELEAGMNKIIDDEGLDLFMLLITDIVNSNSQVIALGKDAKLVEKAYGVELVDNMVLLEGVVSRKKQVVPIMTENA